MNALIAGQPKIDHGIPTNERNLGASRTGAWRISLTLPMMLLLVCLLGSARTSSAQVAGQDQNKALHLAHSSPEADRPNSRAAEVRGTVSDKAGRPVPGAAIKLASVSGKLVHAKTDLEGVFLASVLPGEYRVSLSRHGFSSIRDRLMIIHGGPNRLRFKLLSVADQHGVNSMLAGMSTVGPNPSRPNKKVQAEETRDQTPDVSQVLLDRYGEIRTPGSQGASSKFLVDSAAQGRPRDFGLMNNLDTMSLRSLEIKSKSALGSDYSAPQSNLMLRNRPPGERWSVGLGALAPSLRLQRGIRFGDWNPEISFQGPLPDHRFWFSNTLSADHSLLVIPELPRSADSIESWQASDRIDTDFAFSHRHILNVSLFGGWRQDSHIGLSPLTPISTTVGLGSKRARFSAIDQHLLGEWLLELGISIEYLHSALTPQGGGLYILRPGSASGTYFETLRGDSTQGAVFANIRIPTWNFWGHHETQFGGEFEPSHFDHHAKRRPFEIVGPDGSLQQLTYFIGNSDFSVHNNRSGGYVQDSWTVLQNLRVQIGAHYDYDSLITASGWGPRASVAYLPFANRKTKLFAFSGDYLPSLNLALLGQAEDQLRIDRFYSNGILEAPPQTADFIATAPRLRAPHYLSSKVGVEQQVGKRTFMAASFLERNQRDMLAYQKLAAKKNLELLPLLNNRKDDYRAYEVSIRQGFGSTAEVMASYTRSRTHTNQLFDYSMDSQTFVNQYSGPLEYDAPNRIVSWGWGPLRRDSVLLSYLLEYRTGFPFTVFDQDYQVVGRPNQQRFPPYFRLNLGVEKIFRYGERRIGVRLSAINLTGHQNFIAVDNNISSPTYLRFSGTLGRSYNVRFRLLGSNE